MAQYALKINSYLGSDTRIQVVREKSAKPEKYSHAHLDRDCENQTTEKNESIPPSKKPRNHGAPRTQNRLSPHARKILQRIGGAISAYYDASSAAFLTGTFPGSSLDSQRAIAAQAGWIVDRLKSWIHKRIAANIAYWVWEFQKRGTLHLHYVCIVPDRGDRQRLMADFRDEWIRLISGASKRSGENLFIGEKSRDFFTEKEKLQIYAQECYKNCSSYLSKYLSKSKSSEFPAPCRLWGCTRQARFLVARHCISLEIPSIPLHRAEDLAYKFESYSNAPQERRRYFRHRFSQGFTILLYDDLLRKDLLPPEKMEKANDGMISAIARIFWKMEEYECLQAFIGLASSPLRDFLRRCSAPSGGMINSYSDDEIRNNLIEINSLASEIPALKFYERDNLRNLIGAALKCIQH